MDSASQKRSRLTLKRFWKIGNSTVGITRKINSLIKPQNSRCFIKCQAYTFLTFLLKSNFGGKPYSHIFSPFLNSRLILGDKILWLFARNADFQSFKSSISFFSKLLWSQLNCSLPMKNTKETGLQD